MNTIMDRPSRSKIKEGIHPVFLAAKIIFCPNQAFAAINRPIRHALNARSLNWTLWTIHLGNGQKNGIF